ncbi:MAG: HtaA domain-containing protein [Solirubrobacteraceae bacterium]
MPVPACPPSARRIAAVAIGSSLLLAASALPAGAASLGDVDEGTLTLQARGKAATMLKRAGVKYSVLNGADRKGTRMMFRVHKAQAEDPIRVDAAARHAFRVRVGKRKVTVRGLKLKTGKTSKLRGRVNGGKERTLATVATGKLKYDAKQNTIRGSKMKVTLTKGTARLLRKRLRLPRTPTGTFGRLTADVKLVGHDPQDPGDAVTNVAPLQWAMRASWVSYVTNPFLGGGTVTAEEGATGSGGAFTFAGGKASRVSDGTIVAYGGAVRSRGPNHGIDNILRSPRITLPGDRKTGRLIADGQGSGRAGATGGPQPYRNVPLLDLTITNAARATDGKTVTYTATSKITAEGSPYLTYPAGDEYGTFTFVAPAP